VLAKTTSSVALFSINGAPEAPIAVGEEVTAGAILDAVYPDRIVLRRAGAHEIVLLRDSSKLAPGSLSAPSTTASPGDIGALRSQMPGAGRAHEASVSGVQLPPPGPAQAADIGFEVQQIQPGSAYEQLGLRPGDVVRRVNGQLVNSSDALLRRFADTRGGGSMTVEVMRQGKTETLSYTSPDRR
jgi:general secretion pathway protein C